MVNQMNILFEYLYRDSGNNKKWGEVIFANAKGVGKISLERRIRKTIIDEEFFVSENSKLPKLKFSKFDQELDHDWYEFHSLEETIKPQNDEEKRDILDFIEDIADR